MVQEKTRHRLRKWLLILFFGHLAITIVWSWVAYVWPGPDFIGSPPRKYQEQRNNLDFNESHVIWWGRYSKQFRPRGFFNFLRPSGIATPIVHYFSGWDEYGDICVTGQLASLGISSDDGDVCLTIELSPDDEKFAWRPGRPADSSVSKRLVVEIDLSIRKNFPVIYDLAKGDFVRVCGAWVYDRGHNHNEIHPPRWIELLKEGSLNAPIYLRY